MEIKRNGILLTCRQGDIANQQDMDAVVNAANAQLANGGGVAGAIHSAAGPELAKACRPKAPIRPGEAVITDGFNLPNDYVIHTLGPVYGRDKPESELLKQCYLTSLSLAEENGVERIAFPAISTGIFGYPLEKAIEAALPAVLEMTEQLNVVKEIRFVLFSDQDLQAYQKFFQRNENKQ